MIRLRVRRARREEYALELRGVAAEEAQGLLVLKDDVESREDALEEGGGSDPGKLQQQLKQAGQGGLEAGGSGSDPREDTVRCSSGSNSGNGQQILPVRYAQAGK